jgi:hypothetical protein
MTHEHVQDIERRLGEISEHLSIDKVYQTAEDCLFEAGFPSHVVTAILYVMGRLEIGGGPKSDDDEYDWGDPPPPLLSKMLEL